MTDRMERFLLSIGIKNTERFDMDFEYAKMDQYQRGKVNMVILKDKPWDYYLLEEFTRALQTVNYPYSLRFSYKTNPSVYDAISLFEEWFMSIYHVPSDLKLYNNDNNIIFVFSSEDNFQKYQSVLRDYKDFLSFISYQFFVSSEVVEEKVEVKLSTKEMNKITKKAEKSAKLDEDFHSENDDSYYQNAEQIKKEQEDDLLNAEKNILEQLEANRKIMEEERKRKRKYQKGDYVYFENINDIIPEKDNVDIDGEVFSVDIRPLSNGRKLIAVGVGKKDGAIICKFIENKTITQEKIDSLSIGKNIRVKGYPEHDYRSKELIITGHNFDILPPIEMRKDECEVKRVELHLHTQMSTMDGTNEFKDYAKLAKHMGHKALAVTDHGSVQSFPDAQKCQSDDFKIIYGSELYVVDDTLEYIFNPSDIRIDGATYVVFDLETTGLSARYDRVTEFGGVKIKNSMELSRMDELINPEREIPQKVVELTKITNELVQDKPKFKEIWPKIKEFIGDSILVSHNASFDVGMLNHELELLGEEPIKNPVIDTLALSRYLFPENKRHNLGALARNLEIMSYNNDEAHRADFDAKVLSEIWNAILPKLIKDDVNVLHKDLMNLHHSDALLKHMRSKHVCVLAKNPEGLKDLFKIISESNINYFAGVPKVPKSLLKKYRTNLFVGSSCFNGEVFDAARTRSKDILKEILSFYDYVELQPLDNYVYLLNSGAIYSNEELIQTIKDIAEAAEELNKIVVATGDVHYLNPEDKIVRDVYISAKGVGRVMHPLNLNPYEKPGIAHKDAPDQHFRSTQEMLDAFSPIFGKEKAYEYVVTNTNKIADAIEVLRPIKDKLYTPTIKDSDKILRDCCYKKAHELFGEKIPEFIVERLEKELAGIINNGFAVIYILAREIILKANSDGFMVGSRGSVGSSLVATLSSITEVNPLPPHYLCPKCKYFELSTYKDVFSGFDLPEKKCPICGAELKRDGQNIPFETFLGFSAEKVPDIDLNFPSDYQARAHNYLKVLFSENNVFRAGTIETVAEKTAFGYVRGFYEYLGINPDTVSRNKIAYIASKCQGVKRTTGQHPGGIVVIPREFDVYDFTPIQYPADDKDADWKTTHFDFHAIHDNVLKLDLLGHVDPLALKMMAELTNIDIKDIPMNDQKVLSLFSSPNALGLSRNYLGVKTGSMAIPEFGTEFVQGILKVALPKTFSDLLVISGLSHGTDVWKDNAETLIETKVASGLRDVIGCRDDIMTYLLSKNIPSKVAFSCMEDVRKGKKLKKEYEEIMRANNIPEYYIDSCNKIKYLFPKAHATAYVMQAIRVGYFKVYHPLAFYATFFTARSKQYDIEAMIGGENKIIDRIEEIRRKKTNGEKVSPKEEEILKTLYIAIEMVERGYKFTNLDLYKSDATRFVIDEENNALIPPFIVIDGLGEAAALSVIEAREQGKFLSKKNLLKRTKLNGTNVNNLEALGVLKDLGEEDEMSLFDFSFE